jgi:hypothetical protein
MSFILAILFTLVIESALEILENRFDGHKLKLSILNKIYKGKLIY